MGNKYTFERMEYKYLLSNEQYAKLRRWLKGYAEVDEYGLTRINNIYYDTSDYRIIRKSLSKPSYKEKLRLRSYGTADEGSPVFIELKKKYLGVVYKRRIQMKYSSAKLFLNEGFFTLKNGQISEEIKYFIKKNANITPRMKISYDRTAMAGVLDPELRITFDTNISYSTRDLSLASEQPGRVILKKNMNLMEIKILGSMPLELSEVLSELKIFRTSFSKYGHAYEIMQAERPQNRMIA